MVDHEAQRSVTKIKLDGAVRTHWSRLITAAPMGTWLFAPEGTAVHYDTGELYTRHTMAGVQLLVPGEWWTAWWWPDKRWIGIDVTLPVAETDDGFRYTDLELDLWWQDGDCGIVDQEELEAAVDQGRIDRDTAAIAEHVAAELQQRLRRDREFVEHGFTVLDRSLATAAAPARSPD